MDQSKNLETLKLSDDRKQFFFLNIKLEAEDKCIPMDAKSNALECYTWFILMYRSGMGDLRF